MHRAHTKRSTLVEVQHAKCGFTDAYRIRQHRLENRLEFTRR